MTGSNFAHVRIGRTLNIEFIDWQLADIHLKELKANGVDEKTINSLETEIGRATDKNEAILKVIQKGDIIANKVLEIVNNII